MIYCGRFGNMVAFFHYTPIDILTVHLPSSMLEFNSQSKKEWMRREIEEVILGHLIHLFSLY